VINRPRDIENDVYHQGVLAELANHPHARAVLAPALAPGGSPSHAYLFHGPAGAGKRASARALAAELLAEGSADPDSARARVLSGAHPDLTWVTPSGAHEILVSDIDGPVVGAATRTPFESRRRVFVIERADMLGDGAANRMLKTLEEPAPFVHLLLLTDRVAEVLPTILSRCQLVRFNAPSVEDIAARLRSGGVDSDRAEACARLALGDASGALSLASEHGTLLREAAERFARATLEGSVAGVRPWGGLMAAVRSRGEEARLSLEAGLADELELVSRKERRRVENEWAERTRRTRRRVETAALDLGLQLVAMWYRDLVCIELGAGELVHHVDRLDSLGAFGGRSVSRLRAAVELVEETRQRFQLNVSEELACEALAYRLERLVAVE
jgi:DNA polymerase-3 subunit delta'